MIPPSQKLYEELNKAWKSTCRIILKDEIGELKGYDGWMSELHPNTTQAKSHVSGKEVTMITHDYSKDARFISFEENKTPSVDPLTINEIKDIDSIVNAISEKWEYAGNRVFGNSSNVEHSELVADSQYLYSCLNAETASHAYYCYDIGGSKHTFGCHHTGKSEFLIKSLGCQNVKRCFNCGVISNSSDLVMCHNCNDCQELMFSLHQINKRHCIGNVQLAKDKYAELKKKLIEEIVDEMKRTKRYPHIYEFVPNTKLEGVRVQIEEVEEETSMVEIDKAFTATSRIVFKKDLGGIADYEGWLSESVVTTQRVRTALGSEVYFPRRPASWPLPKKAKPGFLPYGEAVLPDKRIVKYTESLEMGKLSVGENDAGNLDKIKEWISKYGCFCVDLKTGESRNIIESSIIMDSSNLYKSYVGINTTKTALSSWPLYSNHLFGCHSVSNCQFSIKCHFSKKMNRCFEMDSSADCADSMFCHNSAALSDCMFCFNIKSARYAIGNSPLLPDKYRKTKDALVDQIADEIMKNGALGLDIYNIGRGKK